MDPFHLFIILIMEYVNMVKSLVQTGQEYISSMTDAGAAKTALVKINKAAVVYAVRNFNTGQLDSAKCVKTLTELIYLFNQNQQFSEDEAVQIFFSITKLLQSEQAALRRMVYMIIKEMRGQKSIYVVTSSLLKDIHHKNCNFRRNSLRTIPMVIDSTNLVQVERYIKGLIADPDAGVASAALLSGIQMFQGNAELVRKWGNEITQKLTSKDPYVQYHALVLLGDVKQRDTNAQKKLLLSLIKQHLTEIAAVQHLRMLRQVIRDLDYDSAEVKEITIFINRQVRVKDDNVVIEACKLACESPFMSNKDLLEIVKILEPFLVSESTVKKYAVLNIFNSLLKNQSRKSLIVNVKEIEKVLNGKNTSLSSIAASILLRICSEGYLETLFARIEKTMVEMSVEYKVDVVNSLLNVLKTYPKQFGIINQFLLKLMTREKHLDIKTAAISVMNFEIVELSGQARRDCIRELTKFLSSNTYDRIHFQILGIISREATKQDINSEIFKNIISEIFLKEGAVRACGLSTLIKLSEFEQVKRDALERTIQKFKSDRDQQVRDRLVFRTKQKPIDEYELNLIENYLNYNCQEIQNSTDRSCLSMEAVNKWGVEVGPSQIKPNKQSNAKSEKSQADEESTYRQVFSNHPNFKDYGLLRKINKSIPITDGDGELQVVVRIFLFDEAVLAEFKVTNKRPSSILENLRVQLKHSGESFKTTHVIPVKSISYGQTGECYVGLQKSQECQDLFPEEKMTSVAKFTVKQLTGETVKICYEDDFSLQDFEIKLATFMAPWNLDSNEFVKNWQQLKGVEQNGAFQLKHASTEAAEQELVRHFGIRKVENPQKSTQANMITIWLAGKYLGIHSVMLVLTFGFDSKRGCLVKIKAKTPTQELTQELIQSIS